MDKAIKKPFLLRFWLLKPEVIDSVGYLLITIGGFIGMYNGIQSIQF